MAQTEDTLFILDIMNKIRKITESAKYQILCPEQSHMGPHSRASMELLNYEL